MLSFLQEYLKAQKSWETCLLLLLNWRHTIRYVWSFKYTRPSGHQFTHPRLKSLASGLPTIINFTPQHIILLKQTLKLNSTLRGLNFGEKSTRPQDLKYFYKTRIKMGKNYFYHRLTCIWLYLFTWTSLMRIIAFVFMGIQYFPLLNRIEKVLDLKSTFEHNLSLFKILHDEILSLNWKTQDRRTCVVV